MGNPERIPPTSGELEIIQKAELELRTSVLAYTQASRELLEPQGLHVTGSRYFIVPNARSGILIPGITLDVELDITPRNWHEVDFARRMMLVYGSDSITEAASQSGLPTESDLDLAFVRNPIKPVGSNPDPGPPSYEIAHNVSLVELLAQEKVIPGSPIVTHCQEIGLADVTMMDGHMVSPNITPYEITLAAIETGAADSILVIGAGTLPIAREAKKSNSRLVVVDNSPRVISNLKERYPQTAYPNMQFITADAREYLRTMDKDNGNWIVELSTPYELNPGIMSGLGELIAKKASVFICQSGSPGLGQMEHDVLMGRAYARQHPWWNDEMAVDYHFNWTADVLREYEYAIVAGHDGAVMTCLLQQLRQKGLYRVQPKPNEVKLN